MHNSLPQRNVTHHVWLRFILHTLGSRIYLHWHSIKTAWKKMLMNPVLMVVTIIVLGVALALPTGLFVLLNNAKHISSQWQDGTQMTAYFKLNTPEDKMQATITQLKSQETIDSITFISAAEGLNQFKQRSGFTNALALLEKNPLPDVLVIHPAANITSTENIAQLQQQLNANPDIEAVQFDMAWVQRLFDIIHLAQRSILAIAILLAVAVLLSVGITIRLAMQKYRKEIKLMQFIGATSSYIRRPFLYVGIIYGLFSGLLAWLLVQVILLWLQPSINQLAAHYDTSYTLSGTDLATTFTLIGSSTLLGLIGALASVTYYIRAMRF